MGLLDGFPVEIIESIISRIEETGSIEDLSSFSQTCKALNLLCTPLVFRQAELLTMRARRSFYETIRNKPALGEYVEALSVGLREYEENYTALDPSIEEDEWLWHDGRVEEARLLLVLCLEHCPRLRSLGFDGYSLGELSDACQGVWWYAALCGLNAIPTLTHLHFGFPPIFPFSLSFEPFYHITSLSTSFDDGLDCDLDQFPALTKFIDGGALPGHKQLRFKEDPRWSYKVLLPRLTDLELHCGSHAVDLQLVLVNQTRLKHLSMFACTGTASSLLPEAPSLFCPLELSSFKINLFTSVGDAEGGDDSTIAALAAKLNEVLCHYCSKIEEVHISVKGRAYYERMRRKRVLAEPATDEERAEAKRVLTEALSGVAEKSEVDASDY